MQYKPKLNYDPSPDLPGIPNEIYQHHLSLYDGYIRRFNQCQEDLLSSSGVSTYGLLKQRNVEYSGARLHEIYFDQMTRVMDTVPGALFARSASQFFGGIESWRRDFIKMCHTPGPGWAVCYATSMGLINSHISGHDVGTFANGKIIFVVDLWEHAYECYTSKMSYIQSVMSNTDWNVVEMRMEGTI